MDHCPLLCQMTRGYSQFSGGPELDCPISALNSWRCKCSWTFSCAPRIVPGMVGICRYGAYKRLFCELCKKNGCAWKWDTIPLPPKWPSYYIENDDEPMGTTFSDQPIDRKNPNAYWSYINQLTENFYGMDFTCQGPELRILLSFADMLPYWRLTSSLPLWILDPTTTAPSSNFTLEHHPFLCIYIYISL